MLDVSDAEAVERFADEVCAEHGVPDVVVNNAGIGQAGEFLDTPADQWDRVLDVNLGGVVNGCRAFGKRLVERGAGGHIVNVASMAAYSPSKSLNAYCTSKAAVYMFSDCLRAELDVAGIGLTTICPGLTDTNILHNTQFHVPGRSDESVEGRREELQKLFRLRRHGPDKAANAIVSAVKKNKPIRPITPEAYLLYGTSRIAPQALRSTARQETGLAVLGDVLEYREHRAGGHPGAALAGVAPWAAGVVGRGGDVDVRPRHAVGDELA